MALLSRTHGFWLLLIISLAFNAGFGATFGVRTYRQCCGDGGQDPTPALLTLRERLNLTVEQETQMQAAKDKLLLQVEEVRRELTTERETLAELLAAADPDRAAIVLQLNRIAGFQQELQQQVVEHLLEEKELLGPDQREAFNEIIRRRVCPYGGRGPESVPGGCEFRGGAVHTAERGCGGRGGH